MVGTESADWNDSRTKIKQGQEGGGFRGALLSPKSPSSLLQESGTWVSVWVTLRGLPCCWVPRGEGDPCPAGETITKTNAIRVLGEALRRGPEPGLAGRTAVGNTTEGFLVVSSGQEEP